MYIIMAFKWSGMQFQFIHDQLLQLENFYCHGFVPSMIFSKSLAMLAYAPSHPSHTPQHIFFKRTILFVRIFELLNELNVDPTRNQLDLIWTQFLFNDQNCLKKKVFSQETLCFALRSRFYSYNIFQMFGTENRCYANKTIFKKIEKINTFFYIPHAW